jgi:hypothetical protein
MASNFISIMGGIMSNPILLSVGDSYHVRMGKDRIIYAGMPSDNVYSIVQKNASGYQGYAWNLFYPKNKTSLTIDGIEIIVESVTPEEIRMRVG